MTSRLDEAERKIVASKTVSTAHHGSTFQAGEDRRILNSWAPVSALERKMGKGPEHNAAYSTSSDRI